MISRTEAERVFVAESVGVSFVGRQVLKSASVWASPGEVTALFGRNGSGKSTLFRAALGLVTREFGTVRFRSIAYEKPSLRTLAPQGLFYLPDFGLLSRRRTVAWHIAALHNRFEGETKEGFPDGLDIDSLFEKTVWEMSGGEERRAELAVAWARNPCCLLADEPLAGIAPKDREVVSSVIRSMADEGCAVVVTGHDVRPLMDLADRIVWMVAGTTHGLGSPEEAMAHEQFRREYLGPAY